MFNFKYVPPTYYILYKGKNVVTMYYFMLAPVVSRKLIYNEPPVTPILTSENDLASDSIDLMPMPTGKTFFFFLYIHLGIKCY